jgi:hypothetical protein
MISSLTQLTRILVAIGILGGIAFAPLESGAASASITQEEAETFVRSFYHALEGDDFDKVMAHFDSTVQYYNFGAKDRSYVASDLGQYCATYPSRSFSISEIKLKPVPNSDRVTVKFDNRFFIRSPEKDITRGGRSHVEWDLAKRDGALKITRFDGRPATEPEASPSL